MVMKSFSRMDLIGDLPRRLGLSTGYTLDSPEALAGAIRRSASLRSPCTPRQLKWSVGVSLRELFEEPDMLDELLETCLQALITLGDLTEVTVADQSGSNLRQVELTTPCFVMRGDGSALILGSLPGNQHWVPDSLRRRVESKGYLRLITSTPGFDPSVELASLGIRELNEREWATNLAGLTENERTSDPSILIQKYDQQLDAADDAGGEIPGLTILNTERDVTYYKGRWTLPTDLSGRFIGRRPQAYGNDLWCYIDLQGGRPTRFIDLPLDGSKLRGCDAAWHLQLALDKVRGSPQRYSAAYEASQMVLLELFSPIPAWAERRLTLLGTPTEHSKRGLIGFRVPAEEIKFLEENLWLSRSPTQP